ncbi:MAG: 4Fe-4S binding protein [Prevotellaceae bacterium]|nr:4Fe-4S binding protein [Prevotellaceae bacterium]
MTRNATNTITPPYVRFNPHRCKACWVCLDACPAGAIGKISFLWHRHAVLAKPSACTGCLRCVRACPAKAFSPITTKP